MSAPAEPSPTRSAARAKPTSLAPEPPRRRGRDPWVWLSLASVLPIALHSFGAPLCEPVAEDFDFIRHTNLLGRHSLLDGGGSGAFWRPVPHQLYYMALGELVMSHPRFVAAIHLVLLALSSLLLYRAFRPRFAAGAALAIASFPMLSESTRMVISWPGHSVELFSLLFSALALHEASRRRMVSCLGALLFALLSKELAVVAAVMIPWLPDLAEREGPERGATTLGERLAWRARLPWVIATGAVTAAWAAAYAAIRRSAHLALPHGLESNPELLAVGPLERFVWALRNSARAIFSLPAAADPSDRWLGFATLGLIAVAVAGLVLGKQRRARVVAATPSIAWGLVWFLLSTAVLTTIFPIWAPNRSLYGAVGLAVALVALLGSIHPLAVAALVAIRLAAFELSPGPPPAVSIDPSERGAFMDFERLTRLQRLMETTRRTLHERMPTLPRGALIASSNMPHGAIYAFGGDHAVQVWYRDTTLRWVGIEAIVADTTLRPAAVIQYQGARLPQLAFLEPAAIRAAAHANDAIRDSSWAVADAWLVRADSLQQDRDARVFRADVYALRGLTFVNRGDRERAMTFARGAVAVCPEGQRPRLMLASLLLEEGDRDGAVRQLDSLLALVPNDSTAIGYRRMIRAAR